MCVYVGQNGYNTNPPIPFSMGEGDKPGGPGRGPFIVSPVPAFVRPAASAPSAFYPPSKGMAPPEPIHGGTSGKTTSNPPRNGDIVGLEARICALEAYISEIENELSTEKKAHTEQVADLKKRIARLVKKLAGGSDRSKEKMPAKQTISFKEDSAEIMRWLYEQLRREDAENRFGTDSRMCAESGIPNAKPDSHPDSLPISQELNRMTERAAPDIASEPSPQLSNLEGKVFGEVVVTVAEPTEDFEDSGRPTLVDAEATQAGIRLSIRLASERPDKTADGEPVEPETGFRKKKGRSAGNLGGGPDGNIGGGFGDIGDL